MTAIAKIHVLKKNAALDDDSYRDLLERETGKRSSKGMTVVERVKVITALEALPGAKETNTSRQHPNRATGPFAKKLQALWIAAYNLGVTHDKTDRAMMTFVKRQTGLDHTRFLQCPSAAEKAIDGLKLWIRRETGNSELFTQNQSRALIRNDFRFQICMHLWTELIRKGKIPAATLHDFLCAIGGTYELADLAQKDWNRAMNQLGELFRSVQI